MNSYLLAARRKKKKGSYRNRSSTMDSQFPELWAIRMTRASQRVTSGKLMLKRLGFNLLSSLFNIL